MLNPFTLKIKLIIGAVLLAAALWAGIWFRGVLAENKEMKAEIVEVTAEVERMAKQDAADYVLFEQSEQAKTEIAADLAARQKELRRAKEKLNEATRNCLDLTLPDAYLDRLPKAEN